MNQHPDNPNPDPVLEEVTGSLVHNLTLEGQRTVHHSAPQRQSQSLVANVSPALKAIAKKEVDLKHPPPSAAMNHHNHYHHNNNNNNHYYGDANAINDHDNKDHDKDKDCTKLFTKGSTSSPPHLPPTSPPTHSGEGSTSDRDSRSSSNSNAQRHQVTNSNQSDDRSNSNSKLSSNSTYNDQDASVSSAAATSLGMDASASANENNADADTNASVIPGARPLNSIFTPSTAVMSMRMHGAQGQGRDSADVPFTAFHHRRGNGHEDTSTTPSHHLNSLHSNHERERGRERGYRLPYPMDDPLLPSSGGPSSGTTGMSHATVEAKLPPPPLALEEKHKQGGYGVGSSSSSLMQKYRKRKLSSTVTTTIAASVSSIATATSQNTPSTHAIKMVDGKFRKMTHTTVNHHRDQQQQQQPSDAICERSSRHHHHHSHRHHPENDTKMKIEPTIQVDESKESTSDSGSDSGYAASASSNDVSGGTSQSGSSSDSSQQQQSSPSKHGHSKHHHHHKTKSSNGHWTETDDGKAFKPNNSSSCSSELADFSSAGSSNSFCPRQFSFLGPLSESDGSGCEETIGKGGGSGGVSGGGSGSRRQSKKREVSKLSSKTKSKSKSKSITTSPFAPASHGLGVGMNVNSQSVAANAAVDSSPDLKWSHRRRRAAARARGLNNQSYIGGTGAPGSKTTGLDRIGSVTASSSKNNQGPSYILPDTWSFVERQLKEKMNFEDILRKKSYEEHHDELTANYKSAVKRIDRSINSGASVSSAKSSLTTNSSNGNASSISKHPLYDLGVDIMAKILTYLEPTDTYSLLSHPLSKEFRMAYTAPQDLWKVLCLSEPFYAKPDHDRQDSDDSRNSYPLCEQLKVNHLMGRYRLLYSSLIKCTRYLDRVREDAKNGRTPSGSYESDGGSEHSHEDNSSLLDFFASAHRAKKKERSTSDGNSSDKGSDASSSSDEQSDSNQQKKKVKVKYGVSKLTNNLFGPALGQGIAGNVGLPWSCAIYSVVNWMVAFADVVGIQLMCLKVLPDLLVNEHQRTSAQHVGLTDIVLRAMVLFPDVVELHTAAFHTLVLLARPLGGKEGMLFNSSMVNASGIFNVGSSTGKSGIAIMLDSMKRFVDDDDLMAMSCWSMVNIALIPSQKIVLVRLGGISAAVNALIHHPHNAEVQFRALFALINLVIPSENLADNSVEAVAIQEQVAGINQDTETEMLDESAGQVINLVVMAMKNFCSSEPILNRACLVLHNLSLNEKYHNVLLLTPNCYQMLEWCIGNYRHDEVLQRSARGTLTRLQVTLSEDHVLRSQFTATLRMQQQLATNNASRLEGSVLPEEQLDTSMRSSNSI